VWYRSQKRGSKGQVILETEIHTVSGDRQQDGRTLGLAYLYNLATHIAPQNKLNELDKIDG